MAMNRMNIKMEEWIKRINLSLASLGCRMSNYQPLNDFLHGSTALTFAVISCWNCQNNWRLYSSSRIATVATDAETGL